MVFTIEIGTFVHHKQSRQFNSQCFLTITTRISSLSMTTPNEAQRRLWPQRPRSFIYVCPFGSRIALLTFRPFLPNYEHLMTLHLRKIDCVACVYRENRNEKLLKSGDSPRRNERRKWCTYGRNRPYQTGGSCIRTLSCGSCGGRAFQH